MIKFTYFDVGGVVIRDFSGTTKWEELRRELGITPDQDTEYEKFFDEWESKVCVGLDLETLLPMIREKFHVNIPENYSFLQNGFVDHFEINKSIWPVVEEVRKHCRVGLLTNMYPGMFAAIKEKDLLPDVPWEIVVDSSVVGMKKLDRGIYDLAREKAGVENVEIFFVDNNEDNIKTAEELGWKVFHYDPVNPEESSRKLLKEFKSEYLL